MDCCTASKLKMEKALEMGNLVGALSHLDALILNASCSSDVSNLLRDHTIKDLPTLHYLTRFSFREEDTPHLQKLIRIFAESGYDINKPSYLEDGTCSGSTALLASVEQRNLILVECLLRQGARTDILDKRGVSAYHRAIMVGDLKCLEKLVELGKLTLASTSFEISGKMVHPLLHTAVDQGHTEIVRYLLTMEELGVNVNEEAFYRNVNPELSSSAEESSASYQIVRRCDRVFTPVGRALLIGTPPIIEALMEHPGAKSSGLRELHSFLEEGDTNKALSFLKYFSDEDLSIDKIGTRWPLHCIHPKAFSEESRVEFTKKLILEYVRRGWDPNSVSVSTICRKVQLFDGTEWSLTFDEHTLLQLACLNGRYEIIKLLVEEAGADINCKTELTPLQILLILKEWYIAEYLIEKGADLNLRGSFEGWNGLKFTWFMRNDLITGNLELDSTFTSVELLVRMGYDGGLATLEMMLARPEVELHGGNEFHLALEGKNLTYCLKVLQRCAKIISKQDLKWITDCSVDGWGIGPPREVSSLIWLCNGLKGVRTQVQALADLIKLMVALGFDLNTSRDKPLIFYILSYDKYRHTSNLLLRTILKFDHLQLTERGGDNPVGHLLTDWNFECSDRKRDRIVDAIQLLVTHGADVSGIVIGGDFRYHNGSNDILKMLYRAGAKISDEFFTSTTACRHFSGGTSTFVRKKKELKEWKDEFDRGSRLSLKHMCRLEVRKTLKCIGHLKLMDELPKSLKGAVLGTTDEPSLSRAVNMCLPGFNWQDSSGPDSDDDW